MQESSTATSHPPPSRSCRAWRLLALLGTVLTLSASIPCRAETSIYRCTAPDGSIELRQYPCHGRDRSEQVELKPDTKGWEATPEVKRPKPKTRRRKTRSPEQRARAERQQQAACEKKRKHLDEVRRKLRGGYKSGQGETLRRRRDEYDDYLRSYCR